MATSDTALPPAFSAADLNLVSAIRRHDEVVRAALCTLARYGVLFRRKAPERAAAWLDQLAPHPLFKGAQFLFDLLEWEDFMLDGASPPLLNLQSLRHVLDRLAAALRAVGAGLDGLPGATLEVDLTALAAEDDLPALEGGFYLYQDVVLGALAAFVEAPGD
ncbi:MAG: hypothetical protein ABI460_03765 [Caldimonas sp.]